MNAKNHHSAYAQNNQLSLFSEVKKEHQQPVLDTVYQYFLIILKTFNKIIA